MYVSAQRALYYPSEIRVCTCTGSRAAAVNDRRRVGKQSTLPPLECSRGLPLSLSCLSQARARALVRMNRYRVQDKRGYRARRHLSCVHTCTGRKATQTRVVFMPRCHQPSSALSVIACAVAAAGVHGRTRLSGSRRHPGPPTHVSPMWAPSRGAANRRCSQAANRRCTRRAADPCRAGHACRQASAAPPLPGPCHSLEATPNSHSAALLTPSWRERVGLDARLARANAPQQHQDLLLAASQCHTHRKLQHQPLPPKTAVDRAISRQHGHPDRPGGRESVGGRQAGPAGRPQARAAAE